MSYLLDACERGDLQCVKKCLRLNVILGKGVTVQGEAFRRAAQFGHLDILKHLHEHDAITDFELYSVVRTAARHGRLNILKYLIEDLHFYVQCDNNVAIWNAACGGHLDCIKVLVSHGSDISRIITDEDIMAELVRNMNFELVKYLVDYGAPTNKIRGRMLRYLQFCDRKKVKAQKKLYFWWIPICYNEERECGKQMAQHNLDEYESIKKSFSN